MQPIYIQSSHGSLEYDQARMLMDLGYDVYGDFDLGCKQRPKIPGVTDHNSSISDHNLILLHQVPDYCKVMLELLKQGKRVILSSFGQADDWQYREIGDLCHLFPNAYVSPYSKKDEKMHLIYAPPRKVRMIRFGKYLDDFQPWTGQSPVIYASCNNIHIRGHGCGWKFMEKAMKELPIVLGGIATQHCGGIGEIGWEEMWAHHRDSQAFLSFGTAPASLVLTQVEAWCAGEPTVIYDNCHGISGEGLKGIIVNDVGEAISQCKRLLCDSAYRHEAHLDSLENAKQFDVKVVGPQWKELISEVLS